MARALGLGLSLGYWAGGPPPNGAAVVAEADRLGFDSVWTAEAYGSDALMPLAWWGSQTERIKLGTAVAVLPIRNAVHNARALATLDVYSGGRVLYGVGVGWLREEAEAMGMPWDRRGARSEEHVALLRALWCAEGDVVEFHSEFYDLPPMDPEPQPVQRPIPIFIGGHSDIALERAGRIGDGWIAAQMSPERVAEHWPKVLESAERNGRDPASLRLFASMSRRVELPLGDLLAQYRDLGVEHVQLEVHRRNQDDTLDMIRDVAENVLPTVRD
jgi:probable F420-dependent oxidoreductase